MATEVVMPKLGLTMETGTIGSWLVEEGAPVTKGQPLLEIITDKVTMDVEAQVDGVLLKMLHAEGEEVAVSEVIGLIGSVGEDISGYALDDGAVPEEEAPAVPAAVEQSASSQSQSTAIAEGVTSQGKSPHRASPKARKMAAELGVNLGDIQGSGAGGRVVSADLEGLETAPRSVDEPVVDKVLNELPDMSLSLIHI